MDRLEAMSLLLETLDAGSFSAAARRRGVPPATLMRKIGQLEAHLGAALLVRSTRRLAPTEAGRRYVASARRIVAEIAEVERDAAGEYAEPTGLLVVTAPRMFGRLHVLPAVAAFLADHPGIDVDLRLDDGNLDLAAGRADVAIRIGALPDSGLVATRLGRVRQVVVASPAFLTSHPELIRPEDLAGLPNVTLTGPSDAMAPSPAKRSAGRSRLAVNGADVALAAAEAGIGWTRVLHYQAADAVAAGRLRVVLAEFEGDPWPVHALHAPLPHLPQKIRRFLDFAGRRLRGSILATGG